MSKIDNEMRELLQEYTNGLYDDVCEYSQYLLEPKERISRTYTNEYWIKECLPNIADKQREQIEKLMNIILQQEISNIPLCRVERIDGNIIQYKKGDVITFGIRSTSKEMNLYKKILSNEIDGLEQIADSEVIEYHFLTNKSLDISDISSHKAQRESLICGKYKVIDIKKVYTYKERYKINAKPVTEYLRAKGISYKYFQTKTGKQMIKYNENNIIKTQNPNKIIKELTVEKEPISREVIYLSYIE